MFLSQYVKTNVKGFLNISVFNVLLCIFLQMALWGMLIFQSQQDLELNERAKKREMKAWKEIVQQSHLIESYRHHPSSGLTISLNSATLPPNRLAINGRASLGMWQELLDSIQQRFSFELVSMQWQNLQRGEWLGELELSIQPPKDSKEYNDWLPVSITSNSFLAEDWRLLSGIKVGTTVSALLQYQSRFYWVKEGTWLPSLGVMVDSVSIDEVVLFAKNGQSLIIDRFHTGETR